MINKLDLTFIDELDNPSTEFFIENYESKCIPCIIKNHPLNWKAFEWRGSELCRSGNENFIRYMQQDTPYVPDKEPDDSNEGSAYYLKIDISEELKVDYNTPAYFKDAGTQPKG